MSSYSADRHGEYIAIKPCILELQYVHNIMRRYLGKYIHWKYLGSAYSTDKCRTMCASTHDIVRHSLLYYKGIVILSYAI